MIRLDSHSLRKGINKMLFYVRNFTAYAVPRSVFRAYRGLIKNALTPDELAVVESRARYYVRLPRGAKVSGKRTTLGDYRYPFGQKHKMTAYFFDLYAIVKFFNPAFEMSYIFGDVNWEAESPTITKSRPVTAGPTMDAIAKLNKERHFKFVDDRLKFPEKKDMLVMRNYVKDQPHRTRFLEIYHDHPLCDAGQTNPCEEHPEYQKEFVPISEQLKFKFICCLEGNDVATNLKWVMSSNSIAVMPRPKMETWFMEGRLEGGVHYIELRDDYSDLEEKLHYYMEHPSEAQHIIDNAHRWVNQFRNRKTEFFTQLYAMREYFRQTGQEHEVKAIR